MKQRKKEYDAQRAEHCQMLLWQIKDAVGCEGCGTRQDLEFHHRDPAQKAFNPTHRLLGSLKTLGREIEKCDILCRRCHLQAHGAQERLIELSLLRLQLHAPHYLLPEYR